MIKLIDFYKRNLSTLTFTSCVFEPTCSEYAKLAIVKHGARKGVWLAARRILRCHPWQKPRVDLP